MSYLIALVLTASSCSAAQADGYDVADRVLESLGQPSGEQTSTNSNCVITETVDEYGFKSEVSSCPDAPDAALVDSPDLLEASGLSPEQLLSARGDLPVWAPTELIGQAPESVRPLLNEMVDTIAAIDQSCGTDFFSWRAALGDLSTETSEVAELMRSDLMKDFVGTNEAKALSRVLMERALLETGCMNPGGGEPFTTEQLTNDGTLELTSRTALGLSELGGLLDSASSGYLFHFFTTADNYEWLRTQTDDVELIVYGTSQAGAAIDIPTLSQQMSADAGNAFLYGSLAEVQQHWFPEVERYVNPKTVVWLVGAIDLLIDCEPKGREQQFEMRLVRRARTFAASGWFDNVDKVNVLLGPVGPPNTNRGNGIKQPESDPAAIDAHFNEYKERFEGAEFCAERAATISRAVERMENDGRRVVVVGMPLSPVGYDQLPGGSVASSEAIDHLRASLAGTDADVIDFSSALQDRPELWADYTHLTESGATIFTQLLAAELKKLGL